RLACLDKVISSFCFTQPLTPASFTLSLHDALPISSEARSASTPASPKDHTRRTYRSPSRQPIQPRRGRRRGRSRACTTAIARARSEEHTSELQSRFDLVCRLLLEKKKRYNYANIIN